MRDDVLGAMGHVALGSRLKRAGVQMQATAQKWLDDQGCEIASTQMPVILALYREETASTGQLARMLGIAQPGVSRMVDQMESAGWLVSAPGRADRRVREIRLSDAGLAFAQRAEQDYWPCIGAAVAEICEALQGDFLTQLGGLEAQLSSGAFERAIAATEGEGTA